MNQTEILELQNTMTETKCAENSLSRRLSQAKKESANLKTSYLKLSSQKRKKN